MIPVGLRRLAVAVTLASLWSCAGPEPEVREERADLAASLARLAADHGAFDRVLDKGADLATRATLSALELDRGGSLSEQEQALLHRTLRSVIAEFVSRDQWRQIVGRVYAEEFSAAELARILEFYDTPLGHKLIERRATLAARVESETERVFNARLDEFILRADEAVAAALPTESRP